MNKPFATYVVGSLPRPRWVRDAIEERREGKLAPEAADRLFDSAIPAAIRMQERAGLDYVSDGEWRRESYVKVFPEHVEGFHLEAVPSVSGAIKDPAVVGRLNQKGPLTANAARFLKKLAKRRTIVALPSPYILGWRTWHAKLSRQAYPTREEFMEACVPILRAEIRLLVEVGIDHIQIDDPWLLMLGDPDHRKRIGASNVSSEIDLCVRMVNAIATAAGDVPTSMHLCHAHFNRQRFSDTGYEPIIEALGDIKVRRFAMEFAAPQSHGVDVLAKFPKNKIVGLGVIDHCDSAIETPETVAERVEAALKHVPADRMTLNPDCGFSPSAQNPMNFDEAYLKLTSMCKAADILRRRHGP
ncbi:MAG: cobalamin-independent methionine synthase II family protein [Alphaproteobacteria bacterium]|nr:cobalamin-independent methionine synthase II family protein [Alphaproteobacteria bacterium]